MHAFAPKTMHLFGFCIQIIGSFINNAVKNALSIYQ